jgi:hypothetical protein
MTDIDEKTAHREGRTGGSWYPDGQFNPRAMTDRQLFRWVSRRTAPDRLRLVFEEIDRRAIATDYGRNPEWPGQDD